MDCNCIEELNKIMINFNQDMNAATKLLEEYASKPRTHETQEKIESCKKLIKKLDSYIKIAYEKIANHKHDMNFDPISSKWSESDKIIHPVDFGDHKSENEYYDIENKYIGLYNTNPYKAIACSDNKNRDYLYNMLCINSLCSEYNSLLFNKTEFGFKPKDIKPITPAFEYIRLLLSYNINQAYDVLLILRDKTDLILSAELCLKLAIHNKQHLYYLFDQIYDYEQKNVLKLSSAIKYIKYCKLENKGRFAPFKLKFETLEYYKKNTFMIGMLYIHEQYQQFLELSEVSTYYKFKALVKTNQIKQAVEFGVNNNICLHTIGKYYCELNNFKLAKIFYKRCECYKQTQINKNIQQCYLKQLADIKNITEFKYMVKKIKSLGDLPETGFRLHEISEHLLIYYFKQDKDYMFNYFMKYHKTHPTEALRCLRLAKKLGHAKAGYKLGLFYAQSETRNKFKAIKYLSVNREHNKKKVDKCLQILMQIDQPLKLFDSK